MDNRLGCWETGRPVTVVSPGNDGALDQKVVVKVMRSGQKYLEGN